MTTLGSNASTGLVGLVIVTYYPDPRVLRDALSAVSPQVARGVVVDNGSDDLETIRGLLPSHFSIIENRDNLGLSIALNRGVERLLSEASLAWVLTLDQDSVVSSNYIRCLLEQVESLPESERVGLIAGADNRASTATGRLRRVDRVMNSGSLVRASVYRQARYREDFFLDQIDNDFCYQVRTQGLHILVFDAPMFAHELGKTRQLIGRQIHYEPGFRYYLIVRDSFTLFRESRIPFGLFAMQFAWWGLLLSLIEGPTRTISAILRGVRDSLGRRQPLPERRELPSSGNAGKNA